jgi:pimeloyl-ACP methyl ester carboxylesterase
MTARGEVPLHRYFQSGDGLRLHYLLYPGDGGAAPVVCIPGLTRPADDFDTLARALNAQGRRVISLDYRGRGASEWDPDPAHYDLDVEQDDILRALALEGVTRAVFVGTSRGGLHTMRLAKADADLVAAAVLNDIGPEIDVDGLLRIKRYVGKLPPLETLADAVGLTRLTASAAFSGVDPADWEIYARRSFAETPQGVVLRYDPELARSLDNVTPDMEPYDFWPGFEALARGPVLTLRGANSDILTEDIFARMKAAAPSMETFIVEGQGHAPLLMDAPSLERIAAFIAANG